MNYFISSAALMLLGLCSMRGQIVDVRLEGDIYNVWNAVKTAPVVTGDHFRWDFYIDYAQAPVYVSDQYGVYSPFTSVLTIGSYHVSLPDSNMTVHDNGDFGDGYQFDAHLNDHLAYAARLWTSDLSVLSSSLLPFRAEFPLLGAYTHAIEFDDFTIENGQFTIQFAVSGNITSYSVITNSASGAVPEAATYTLWGAVILCGIAARKSFRRGGRVHHEPAC